MSYRDFTLGEVKKLFNLTTDEGPGIFDIYQEQPPSHLLVETLAENVSLALAINTEKARSEMISTEAEIFSYVLSPLSLWERGKIPPNFCFS